MERSIVLDERASALVAELAEQWVATHHLPGVVVSIFDRTDHLPSASRGLLAIDHEAKPDDDTLFRIASMTKSFTSAAVLALRDDGVLDLDAPLADLAPSLAGVVGSTTDAPPITLRLLLTMSAGFATDDPWADRLLDADRATMDDLFGRGAHTAHPTATAFQYSNYGFAMIGRAVEEATGEAVRHHVSRRLLEPLGMTDTVWDPPDDHRAAAGHRWSPALDETGDGAWQVELPPLADGGVAPMGGLWSTVADLRRWVRFMLDAFPARNDPDDGPLRRSSRREQQQIHRSHGVPGTSSGYGMGLQVMHDVRLGTVVAHSGGLPGFGSNMRWLVDHGIGIVALSNLTYAPMAALTTAIADRLPTLAGVDRLPRRPSTSAEVDAAHRFLTHVLGPSLTGGSPRWSSAHDGSGWAINVELDEAFERRAAFLARQVEQLRRVSGATDLAFGKLTVESGSAGHFTIEPIESGIESDHITVSFTLSAESPPKVQHLAFTLH